MSVLPTLVNLYDRGIELSLDGTALRVRPRGSLTDAERSILSKYKTEVVAVLSSLVAFEADGTADTLRHHLATFADVEYARLYADALAGDAFAAVSVLLIGRPTFGSAAA